MTDTPPQRRQEIRPPIHAAIPDGDAKASDLVNRLERLKQGTFLNVGPVSNIYIEGKPEAPSAIIDEAIARLTALEAENTQLREIYNGEILRGNEMVERVATAENELVDLEAENAALKAEVAGLRDALKRSDDRENEWADQIASQGEQER